MQSSLALLFLLLSAQEASLIDRVVAVVNNEVITQYHIVSELRKSGKPLDETSSKKAVLNQLISNKLFEQEITNAQISISEEDLDRAIIDILRQNKISESDLESAILARGMSMEVYRKDLEDQLRRLKIIDLKVRNRVSISETELKEAYAASFRGSKKEEVVDLQHLFFKWGDEPSTKERTETMKRADIALAKLKAGKNFEKLAKEMSDGPTKDSGGSLGEMEIEGLLPELRIHVQRMKTGELSGPIPTPTGIHIVRVNEIRAKAPVSFEKMRDKLHQQEYQKELERQVELWLQEVRKNAVIDIRDPELKPV